MAGDWIETRQGGKREKEELDEMEWDILTRHRYECLVGLVLGGGIIRWNYRV